MCIHERTNRRVPMFNQDFFLLGIPMGMSPIQRKILASPLSGSLWYRRTRGKKLNPVTNTALSRYLHNRNIFFFFSLTLLYSLLVFASRGVHHIFSDCCQTEGRRWKNLFSNATLRMLTFRRKMTRNSVRV